MGLNDYPIGYRRMEIMPGDGSNGELEALLIAFMYVEGARGRWRYEQMGHEYVWRWFTGKELEFRTGKSIAIDNCMRFGKWK